MPGPYTIERVTMSGTVLATLTDARIEQFTDVLNEPGTLTFTLPATDAQATMPLMSEVRVREGTGGTSRIRWWGFVSRVDAEWDRVRFQCTSLVGYFKYRWLSYPAPNLLTNGGFEDTTGQTFTGGVGSTTPAGWTRYAADGGSLPWARPVSTHRFTGTYGMRVEETTAGRDVWVGQTISGLSTASAPITYELAADLHIATDSVNTGVYGSPPIFGFAYGWRLLSLIVIDTTTGRVMIGPDGATVEAHYLASWATGHVIGRSYTGSERPIVRVTVPPNRTFSLDVRLYAPKASVVYDNATLVQPVAINGDIGQDIAAVIRGIATSAQSTAYGKTDLQITVNNTTVPDTGVRTAGDGFAYGRDINAFDALDTFTRQDQGVDLAVTWADVQNPTARQLTGWAQTQLDGRGRGSVIGSTLTGSHVSRIIMWDQVDGAGNVVAVIAPGVDGADPEIGWASDLSTFGGVAVELREPALPGLGAPVLTRRAVRRLRQVRSGIRVADITLLPDATPFVDVLPGDVIPCSVTRGRISLTGNWRVMARRVTPIEGTVTLSLTTGG